jgi:hypothetical protein
MSHDPFGLGLAEPARSGVYQVDVADLDTLGALARDAGLQSHRIDLEGCADKRTLLLRLATQLDFPPGFGRNWDALTDALRDLSWLPAARRGYALLLDGADALGSQAPADFAILLDILDDAATFWREEGLGFFAFVAMALPEADEADPA